MSINVIILNGPPGSGKDTLADILISELEARSPGQVHHLRFKDELYAATAEHYGVALDYLMKVSTDTKLKELPQEPLGNISPREALINVSENIIKPKHGEGYFGSQLGQRISSIHNRHVYGWSLRSDLYFVISDSGFYEELYALLNSRIDTMVYVRLNREGKSFKKDSRKYLQEGVVNAISEYCGVTDSVYLELTNDGSLEDLRTNQVREILEVLHGSVYVL